MISFKKIGTGTGTGKKSKNEPKLDDYPRTRRTKNVQFEYFGIE